MSVPDLLSVEFISSYLQLELYTSKWTIQRKPVQFCKWTAFHKDFQGSSTMTHITLVTLEIIATIFFSFVFQVAAHLYINFFSQSLSRIFSFTKKKIILLFTSPFYALYSVGTYTITPLIVHLQKQAFLLPSQHSFFFLEHQPNFHLVIHFYRALFRWAKRESFTCHSSVPCTEHYLTGNKSQSSISNCQLKDGHIMQAY